MTDENAVGTPQSKCVDPAGRPGVDRADAMGRPRSARAFDGLRRRRFLAGLSGGTATALTGCLDALPGLSGPESDTGLRACAPVYEEKGPGKPVPEVDREGTGPAVGETPTVVELTVDPGTVEGGVEPGLLGGNLVYSYQKDVWWRGTAFSDLLYRLGIGFVRFPGGEVTDMWHWKDPDGRGWSDKWKEHSAPPKPDSEFLSVDEYLANLDEMCGVPMMGINVESGLLFDRVDEAVRDAKDLVEYVNDERDGGVAHWYIGNEQHWGDGSPHRMGAGAYADEITRYASAIRGAADRDLEVIANWENHWENGYDILLEGAGDQIDWVDMHLYWWGHPTTVDRWRAGPMRVGGDGMTFTEKTRHFRSKLDEAGYEDVSLVSTEWNTFWENDFGMYPRALMNAEQFVQFARGALDASCYYPINHYAGKGLVRPSTTFEMNDQGTVVEHPTFEKNPAYRMFSLFTSSLGADRVASDGGDEKTVTMVTRDGDGSSDGGGSGDALVVYAVRKGTDPVTVSVDVGEFADVSALGTDHVRAEAYTYPAESFDRKADDAVVESRPWETDPGAGTVAFTVPDSSFGKLTVTRP